MQCAVLKEPGVIEVNDCPRPQPGPQDVLVKVELAAICGSDAALFQGKYGVPLPVIPGHEGIGHIAAVGAALVNVSPGQRVVINPNFACGHCAVCRRGHRNICPAKVRLGIDVDGVFAEYVVVPCNSVMVLPEELAAEKAIFIEPLAVVYHAFTKARPAAGQRVLVIGAGVMGLLAIQLIRSAGAHPVALDPQTARADIARRLGAAAMLHDAAELAEHEPFDMIYETSGAPQSLNLALEHAAPAARIVLIGLAGTPSPVTSSLIVRKELQIFGAMIYTDEFSAAQALLEQDLVDVEVLISDRCQLADVPQRLGAFSDPQRIKTVVYIGSAFLCDTGP